MSFSTLQIEAWKQAIEYGESNFSSKWSQEESLATKFSPEFASNDAERYMSRLALEGYNVFYSVAEDEEGGLLYDFFVVEHNCDTWTNSYYLDSLERLRFATQEEYEAAYFVGNEDE